MGDDPVVTDPDLYSVVFENDRVRVLSYADRPGDQTHPHHHPDSVMITMSSFQRRLRHGEQQTDVALEAGQVRWLDAQEHSGENIGDTANSVLFIELKEPGPGAPPRLGPV